MDVGTLGQWLWDAACEIRGPLDAPKFKDYILPLAFLKRLSDVVDDEVARPGYACDPRLVDVLGSWSLSDCVSPQRSTPVPPFVDDTACADRPKHISKPLRVKGLRDTGAIGGLRWLVSSSTPRMIRGTGAW